MPGLQTSSRSDRRGHRQRLAGTDLSASASGAQSHTLSKTENQEESKSDCVDVITRMVEGEIIPRLLLAHQSDALPQGPFNDSPRMFGPELTEDFAQRVLSSEIDALLGFVEGLLARGVSIQSIYMDLLAPTARQLGEYWNQDRCSFSDVTVGLGRLQQILHEMSRRGGRILDGQQRGRSVLLATAPNEQHTFGLLVIEEFFRRAGWRTWCEPGADANQISQIVGGQWYDLFGLSVSCDSHLEQVSSIIKLARRSSRNRAIRVMVGGRLFSEHPDLALSVGADESATSGPEAVSKAENVVRQLEGRC